ncbi:Lsr2 family DNA-binding protein [Curtobacterium flaccumfaciens]|uniref:Lsr2 family DNA-binding protein n=1 Tax=Curtobacterium flaccumfaciens TaxID=2035 RepID=UPI001BDEE9B6|nr:Lsr2 family protein [Curtobacterium flaccumfaciens pv. flaccumfaciens]
MTPRPSPRVGSTACACGSRRTAASARTTGPSRSRASRCDVGIAAARKIAGRTGRTNAGAAPKRGNSEELAKIREWANANGREVSSRGRISQAVRDAYDAAH